MLRLIRQAHAELMQRGQELEDCWLLVLPTEMAPE